MKTFINMLRDDRGASAAEYALILAIIGAVIAIAAITLAGAIGGAMDTTADCIKADSCELLIAWAAVFRHGRPFSCSDRPGLCYV